MGKAAHATYSCWPRCASPSLPHPHTCPAPAQAAATLAAICSGGGKGSPAKHRYSSSGRYSKAAS